MKKFILDISALEDEDITLRRNMGIWLPIYAVSYSIKNESSATLVRKTSELAWKNDIVQNSRCLVTVVVVVFETRDKLPWLSTCQPIGRCRSAKPLIGGSKYWGNNWSTATEIIYYFKENGMSRVPQGKYRYFFVCYLFYVFRHIRKIAKSDY